MHTHRILYNKHNCKISSSLLSRIQKYKLKENDMKIYGHYEIRNTRKNVLGCSSSVRHKQE